MDIYLCIKGGFMKPVFLMRYPAFIMPDSRHFSRVDMTTKSTFSVRLVKKFEQAFIWTKLGIFSHNLRKISWYQSK